MFDGRLEGVRVRTELAPELPRVALKMRAIGVETSGRTY